VTTADATAAYRSVSRDRRHSQLVMCTQIATKATGAKKCSGRVNSRASP